MTRGARLALCSVALWGTSAALRAEPVTLARGAHALLPIVLGHDPIAAERTAAEELAHYLGLATHGRFRLVAEAELAPDVPAIRVGPTALARELGFDLERLGPEEWRMRSSGGQLVLAGGRPRGTLYAVYRFLEDQVGVRWFTPYEEGIPARPELEVDVDAAGQPAFAYRDIQGVRGPPAFKAHNRANGHFSFLDAAHGGRESYGPPSMVHTAFQYFPPERYFAEHPEFYAEREGRRRADKTQLCLTNDALFAAAVEKLSGYIDEAREAAARAGEPPPRLFDFSQNDWARPCTCASCRALDEREGSPSASLVQFVNRLAEAIAPRYPDVLLDTLAYEHTFEPPRGLALRDNVVLRLAALYQRDFARPVTDPENRDVGRAIEEWARRTRHLRIWDYTVAYGRKPTNLPQPSLDIIAADFRYYLEQGVEGLFIQHESPVTADMRDLKLWVVFKLAEDPTRDVATLVSDFTSRFYGAAAGTVRSYLALVERAARARPASIRYPVEPEQFRYLTPAVLREGQALFERAEREVRGDRVLRERLRRARFSLDRATLLLWDPALAPLRPREIAARVRATARKMIRRELHPAERHEASEILSRQVARALARAKKRLPSPLETLDSPANR